MTIEPWAVLAAVLLAAAAASGGLVLFGVRGPWRRMVVALRAASLVSLALALSLAVADHGEPSPFDLRQLALALGLVVALIGLALAWRHGTAGAGPMQDLVAMSLALAAVLAIQPGGLPLSCVQGSLPFGAYWSFFVLGAGSLLLAGSMALDLGLVALVPEAERRMPPADAYGQLADATFLGLAAVGAGLAISIWWSWRTAGGLLSGDPRQTWLGATWLVAGMSLLAWPLERRGQRIAAALALVAAVMALLGLLAIPELQQLWGL